MSFRSCFLLAALFTMSVAVSAKDPLPEPKNRWNPKCDSLVMQRLAFWVGEWDLDVRQRMGPDSQEFRTGRARETFRIALDNCVLVEELDGSELPRPFTGMSFTTFDQEKNRVQQTWVDNNGKHIRWEGELKEDRLQLTHEANSDGKKVLWRLTFHSFSLDEFDWDIDQSVDAGRTWRNFWKVHCTRNTDQPVV